ncbi:phosphatase PAP2 family protein [Nesterenkonia haasae]|uniref:phosphatase PAP2 family protein n=1 Tax=Nesterenkonia haasae TaxID=2587813 RepID=UPI001391FBFA|nr:phosphatase PAP2 family protein [Nesterenkonia haasae]
MNLSTSAATSSIPRQKPRHHGTLPFLLRQSLVVLVAVITYFGVRHFTEGSTENATRNAELVINLQERIGISVERDFQAWALELPGIQQAMNTIYIWGHWPVIVTTLGWLAWKKREKFTLYRNTLVISGLVGMVIVATFPMAPPRLLDIGVIDTVTMHSEAYRVLQPPSLTNQYAAMPSFHFGWNLLIGIALAREAPALWARIIGWGLPLLMLLSIVITGNHFILDAAAGAAIILTSLAVSTRHQRRIDTKDSTEPPNT